MTEYSAKLLERKTLAGDTAILRFEKPAGFDFNAGQWCLMTVPDMGFQDERGLKRAFSIASSPLEKDLIFATRLSVSAMKRTLAEMALGTAVTLGSPMGKLVLPPATEIPLVFLAGGIGITPFRSMMKYAADTPTSHTITLFYSSKTPEETPFLDELLAIAESAPRIKAAITMTRPDEGSHWKGLTGRLNSDMIKTQCKAWEHARYFIVGPPAMTDTMKQILDEIGIPADRVTLELFAGY